MPDCLRAARRFLLLLPLSACAVEAPLPFLGDCAVHPNGIYQFGDIEIGTCLAGPQELHLTDDAEGRPHLLVVNANPYKTFKTGSLLSIPLDEVDELQQENLTSEIEAGALPLPDYSAGFSRIGDLGIIASRLSEGALRRQHYDDVLLVDLSDVRSPKLASRGDNGSARVGVQSDPIDVELDPSSGLAFVANRTTHSISVIDASQDEVRLVRPWPQHVLTGATFEDPDGSGSRAALDDLAVFDKTLLTDERWSLDWVAGTWRAWLPADGGLLRWDSPSGTTWTPSPTGLTLETDGYPGGLDAIEDPGTLSGRLFFVDQGTIRAARNTGSASALWAFEATPILEPELSWERDGLGGPAPIVLDGVNYLFYDAQRGSDSVIHAAASSEGAVWTRLEGTLLSAQHPHESAGVYDPAPLVDPETGENLVFYSAFDGFRWTIGRAASDDLSTWEQDPFAIFEIDGVDVAAPVLSAEPGRWLMWYSRRDSDGIWRVAYAESPDGLRWTDKGVLFDYESPWTEAEEPPGLAVYAAPDARFRAEGEDAGPLGDPIYPGLPFADLAHGWSGVAVAGFLHDAGDAGAESAGGVRVDSALIDAGLAWTTLTSAGGIQRIGLADLDEQGALSLVQGPVFEGTAAWDRDGVSTPVVWQDQEGTYRMLYAGRRGTRTSIGLATSPDGITWTRVRRVLAPEDDWEAVSVEPGSIEQLSDGRVRLWYSGYDGDIWRIGSAISEDGQRFTRERPNSRGFAVTTGKPGDWDDSGVRYPWVLRGTDSDGKSGKHLWYSGTDGELWRLGYAFIPDSGDVIARNEDEFGVSQPVLPAEGGLFSTQGVIRPVLYPSTEGIVGDAGWTGWFTGISANKDRVGGLSAVSPTRLHRQLARPTLGDSLQFSTERGDPNAKAIPLDTTIDDIALTGIGLTSITVDSERGFLYAASKLVPYLFVIDIRDDSTETFQDLNYLDIESVLVVTNAGGGAGFRQVVPVPGSNRLYGLHNSPESVWVLSLDQLVDNEFSELIFDVTLGYLPAHRGYARDVGGDTFADVGPAGMALHPDGRRLFVTSFNTNSLLVYDLTIGTMGTLIAEVPNIGENPSAILIDSTGTRAYVANHAGELIVADPKSGTALASATLAVIDVDATSPSYLQVLTWLKNL